MINRQDFHLSFSGMKSAIKILIEQLKYQNIFHLSQTKCDIAASFQLAIAKQLVNKTNKVIKYINLNYNPVNTIVLCGGVAANQYLSNYLQDNLINDMNIIKPSIDLCGDNGINIAYTGALRYHYFKQSNNHDIAYNSRWNIGPMVV